MISLIAAMDKNRVIGKGNAMPWHMPADLKHFRNLTRGKPVIMGRKTFESIGRPLPDRKNLVLSRHFTSATAEVQVFRNIDELRHTVKAFEEVFVIGGEEIYKIFLPFADQIYLTEIDTEIDGGDAFFPKIQPENWLQISAVEHLPDEKNKFAYRFLLYRKIC